MPAPVRLTKRGRYAGYALIILVLVGAFMAGMTDECWNPETGSYGTCAP